MPSLNGWLLRTNQLSGTDEVWIERFDGGSAVRLLTISQELTAGDIILLRAKGSTIEAWRHNGTAWSRLGFVHSATHSAAGYVGVGLRGTTGRLDDFGARTLGGAAARHAEPPSAPGTLRERRHPTQIDLSWGPPTTTRRHPLPDRALRRARAARTSPNRRPTRPDDVPEHRLNPTSYSYRVRAEDAVPNEGPLLEHGARDDADPAATPSLRSAPGTPAGNAP